MFGVQLIQGSEWVWIHPVARYPEKPKPYTFTTQEAAESCMRMCYPDQVRAHSLGGEMTVRVHPYPGEMQ